MKKPILAVLIIFSLVIKYELPAVEKVDSLINLVSIQNASIEKVDNLLLISGDFYKNFKLDSAEYFTIRALELAISIDYSQGAADAYYRHTLILNKKGNYNSAIDNIVQFLSIADSLEDSLRLAKGHWLYGTLMRNTGEPKIALSNFKNSLKFFTSKNDSIRMLSIYNSLGSLYFKLAKYDSAAFYYHKTIDFCEATGNEKGVASVLNNLGKTYALLPHPKIDEARELLLKSLEINKKYNNLPEIALSYSHIANIANDLHELDTALYYYGLVEEISNKIGDTLGLIHNYNNIAEVYEKQEKYDEALQNYQKALVYYSQQSIDEGIIVSLLNIADIYVDLKKYSKAHIYYDSSLRLAENAGYRRYQRNALLSKSEAYYSEGNYKEAYHYIVKEHDLSDSIFNLNTAEQIAELKIKYEKEKDQAKILRLEKANLEKDFRLKIRTNQRNVYLYIGLSALIIMLFVILYLRQRSAQDKIIAQQKIRQLEEEKKIMAAKSLVEGQEEERKRMATELHDGLGVILSAAKMQFSTIKYESSANRELIEKATSLINQASSDVRKISHNMMPGLLTQLGLFVALEELIEKIDKHEGVNVLMDIPKNKERLPENMEIMIYRIIQEMINNTLKHAKAENISLIIKLDTEGISIEFKDDGVGFIVKEKLESNTIGLNSIHSRVNFLNGTIKIESIPSKGVKYNILIPFSFKQNRT